MSDQAFAAIGQLIYYEHYFERDWKGVVEAKAVVYGDGMDEVTAEVVRAIKAKLGIITWHVSEEGRVTLIDGEETLLGREVLKQAGLLYNSPSELKFQIR